MITLKNVDKHYLPLSSIIEERVVAGGALIRKLAQKSVRNHQKIEEIVIKYIRMSFST